jgi:hypothetical protein
MWVVSAARSENRLLRAATFLGCTLALVSLAAAPSLAAGRPPPSEGKAEVPESVERLWSQYPLNPSQPAADRRSERSSRPVVESNPSSQPEARDDSEGRPARLLLPVAAAIVGLLAALVVLRRGVVPALSLARSQVPSRRRGLSGVAFLERSGQSGIPDPRTPEGGRVMSYLRRFRGSGTDDEEGAAVEDDESSVKQFLSYSVRADDEGARRASDRVPEVRQDDVPAAVTPAEDVQPAPAARWADPAVYDQLGEHVSTVLSSADEAAKRLQDSAKTEAERIRAEAEAYAEDTRASADAYAEERREAAEGEASAIVLGAETRARELREAAEEEALNIQSDAMRRRQGLFEESERAEERLRNLLDVFRAMTERLEDLVGSRTATEEPLEARGGAADETLTEALIAQSRSSSTTEESHPAET